MARTVAEGVDAEPVALQAANGRPWPDQTTQILLDVAESMMNAEGEPAALDKLARLALQASGADRCAILVRDPQVATRLLPAAGASRVGDEPKAQWERFRRMGPIDMGGHPERLGLWEAQRTVTLHDALSSPIIPDRWKLVWQSKSLAMTALRAGGTSYGVLAVDYITTPHVFTSEEARLLDAIACAAGVALRNTRLVEELQRRVEVERRLAECSAAVQTGESLGEVLDLVVEQFGALLPGISCSINLLSRDQQSFRVAAHRGEPPAASEIRLADLPSKHLARIRQAWRRDPATPVVVPDVKRFTGWQDLVPPSLGPCMLVPLSDGKDVLGFIAAGRERDPFSKEEVRLAVALAGQATIAVSKATLHQTLQARIRLIEALTKLNDVVLRKSDLREVITSLNASACREIGVQCTGVTFADPIVTALLRTRRPNAREKDVLQAWRASPTATPQAIQDDILVPIPIRGRPSGILRVHPLREVESMTLDFLEAIAGRLGEIASKAKLKRSVERRSRELAVAAERERIARDLHNTVGQTFYGIGLKLQDLMADIEDPSLLGRLSEVRALAARAVADVRSAVYALSFLHVRARGLLPSLRALTRQFERETGILAEFRTETKIPPLTEESQSALFRIAHEALVNVDRHARATGVVVTVAARDKGVELSIRDDGVGLDQRQVAEWQSAAHFGMRAMARAAAEVGGQFSVAPADPRGLVITTSIPSRSPRRKPRT